MPIALEKIRKRAKQLKKDHPRTAWTELIKMASKEYRSGKLGAAKSSYRQTGKSDYKRDEERHAMAPGKRIIKQGKSSHSYYERRKNRSDVPGSLTGVSASKLVSELKARLRSKIDDAVLRKYHATKKSMKKKFQKEITALRSELRKLS